MKDRRLLPVLKEYVHLIALFPRLLEIIFGMVLDLNRSATLVRKTHPGETPSQVEPGADQNSAQEDRQRDRGRNEAFNGFLDDRFVDVEELRARSG